MKTLLNSILIILLSTTMCSAQRYLQITDSTILDRSTKMLNPSPDAWEQDIGVLFDKYGFLKLQTTAQPNSGKMFQTETKVGYAIEKNATDILEIHGYVAFLNQWIGKAFGVYGTHTPQGDVLKGKIVPRGDHTLTYNSPHLYYLGTWEGGSGCNCKYSNDVNSYIHLIFSGTGVKVYGEKMRTHGIAKLTLDGQDVEIDQYQDRDGSPVELLYEITDLEDKQHVLKIAPTGQKNPAATNAWLVIKKIEVENKPPVVVQIVNNCDTVFNKVDPSYTLKSKHNEFHKALESAIENGGKILVRKGQYEVYIKDNQVIIVQPNFEVK